MHKTALAIDVGATFTRIALVNEVGEVTNKLKFETPKTALIEKIIETIKSNYKAQINEVAGIGFCIAGDIDNEKGALVLSPNLPYQNLKIKEPLEKEFDKKVYLNNDANAAIIGEKIWGQGKDISNLVYVTFSSGIGGSVFVDGKLITDEAGNSIEVGHTKISSDYNLPCGCGGIDHWESYASGRDMPSFLSAWIKKNNITLDFDGSTVFTIFDAIKSQNKIALQFLEQLMIINQFGINILIKRYHPELIILGGSVYLKHQDFFLPYLPQNPPCKPASFGDNASLVGAAAVVFDSN